MTARHTIRAWLLAAQAEGATHVIIVCDTFDQTDYPVAVDPGENVRDVAKKYDLVNMQRIMEVYALHLDIEKQLAEPRAYHYETVDQEGTSGN